jgi:subtilisin family serine protease
VVDLGIAVVAAAGNNGEDLDAFTPPAGAPNPFHRAEFDSGAVIVGACKGPNDVIPLEPMGPGAGATTSFGTRVDCFAQGRDVVTLSTGPGITVTNQFGGTSSASTIVAATAAIVSALFTEAKGTPIPPRDLRQLLSNSAVNTASASPGSDLIGSMPNLNAIISNGF